MAVFRGEIRSRTLGMDTSLQVILPYDRPAEVQQTPCKVLYLLHGLGENATTWCRQTAVERYAREYGFAVVMPEVQRSFYIDMALGLPYFAYVTEELPALAGQMFHLSTAREDTFVAGLSMGGYGALKCALRRPDLFSACASFSGVVDLHYLLREHLDDENRGQFQAVFGPELRISGQDDIALLARKAAALPPENRPRILMTCGREDFLLDSNRTMRDELTSLPLDLRYLEWDGAHEWAFWDRSLQIAFPFFLGMRGKPHGMAPDV